MTNVAIAGCGHIHMKGFSRRLVEREDVRVKWVWDHDAERAKKWVEVIGSGPAGSDVGVPGDLGAIWSDEEIAAVIVCSETNRHEELVQAGAAAKKHLFVEKPLGKGAKDAYRMADAIERAGVLFQTGYFQRGNRAHLFLRQELEKGNFGKVTRMRHSNCHSGSLRGLFDTEWRWMADPTVAGCGGFGDLGTHSLDILLWLMGQAESVTAEIGVATGRYGQCDEFGEGLLKFSNGAVGSLAAGWVDVAHPINLILSGTEGHAHVAGDALYYQSNRVEGADGKQPWTNLPEAWPHAFELFLDAVGGKKDVPLVGVREAAYRSAVMEAMYESARQRKWVEPR